MGGIGEIFKLGIPWTHLVLRAVIIYVVFFIGLRLFGKRELGQFTTFDLVLVLLVANALQPAITGPDQSVTGGAIIVAILLVFNRAVAMLRSRWPWFDALIEPPPTVLVADVAGSTALGDALDPEDVRVLLRRYYDVAREVVTEHGGILEKFIGDAVVAVFGFPYTHDDDPQRALAAALTLRDRVRADPGLGE